MVGLMTHNSVWPVVSSQVVNGPPLHSSLQTCTYTETETNTHMKNYTHVHRNTRDTLIEAKTHTGWKHAAQELAQSHRYTHTNTHPSARQQLFPTCWGGLETTSSQRVKHILFIYCSLKQAGRPLSLHTHTHALSASWTVWATVYMKGAKHVFSMFWMDFYCVYQRHILNLVLVHLRTPFMNCLCVSFSVWILVLVRATMTI